jgi:hypothetical protein
VAQTDGGEASDGVAKVASLLRSWWLPVAVLAVALRGFALDAPFGLHPSDFDSLLGTFATGGPVTDLAQRGLFESGGMPVQWRVDLADGPPSTVYYLHHPATFMLLSAAFVQALGVDEWVLRLPTFLFALGAVAATYVFVRGVAGERVARLATLFMAVVPFAARDGLQPWTEGAIAGTTALVLHFSLRFVEHGVRKDLVWAAVWLAAGGALDWPAYFVLPGLGVHALVCAARRGTWRRLIAMLVLPATALLLIGAHKLHMHLVVDAATIAADTGGALTHMSWAGLDGGAAGFFARQWTYLVRGTTASGVVLLVLGLLVVSRSASRARAALVLGLLPGVAYVLLFPGRSTNHTFFMAVSAPALCLGAALAVDALVLRVQRFGARPALVVCALLALAPTIEGVWRVVHTRRTFASDQLDVLRTQPWLAPLLADERAVVFTSIGRGMALPFHSRAPIVYGFASYPEFESLRRTIVDHMEPDRRAVFLFDQFWGAQVPTLAPLLEALAAEGRATRHEVAFAEGVQVFWTAELPTGAALAR